MLSNKEKSRRLPIWIALSEFYLDTELGDEDIYRITEVFKKSNYTIEELKEINYAEVAPVLAPNLMSTVGVWSGFDKKWLIDEVMKRINGGKSKSIFNKIYRLYIDLMTNRYWKKVASKL